MIIENTFKEKSFFEKFWWWFFDFSLEVHTHKTIKFTMKERLTILIPKYRYLITNEKLSRNLLKNRLEIMMMKINSFSYDTRLC